MNVQEVQDMADMIESYGQALLDLVADMRAATHADFPENCMMYRQNERREAL